ncbi:MAG: ACT domain-containing protein [Nitrospira sp.]|nr:MAG: ACT domain-containing protein [Nitrospira sp.]
MADLIRTAQYFKMQIADTSGKLAHVLAPLHEAGVNLLAVHAFPRNRRTQVDLVPEVPTPFKNTAKLLKWNMQGPQTCFLVDGDDRPGALADLTAQLASSRINITAVTGRSAGQGRFGAILWVKPRDVKKAAKVFGIA